MSSLAINSVSPAQQTNVSGKPGNVLRLPNIRIEIQDICLTLSDFYRALHGGARIESFHDRIAHIFQDVFPGIVNSRQDVRVSLLENCFDSFESQFSESPSDFIQIRRWRGILFGTSFAPYAIDNAALIGAVEFYSSGTSVVVPGLAVVADRVDQTSSASKMSPELVVSQTPLISVVAEEAVSALMPAALPSEPIQSSAMESQLAIVSEPLSEQKPTRTLTVARKLPSAAIAPAPASRDWPKDPTRTEGAPKPRVPPRSFLSDVPGGIRKSTPRDPLGEIKYRKLSLTRAEELFKKSGFSKLAASIRNGAAKLGDLEDFEGALEDLDAKEISPFVPFAALARLATEDGTGGVVERFHILCQEIQRKYDVCLGIVEKSIRANKLEPQAGPFVARDMQRYVLQNLETPIPVFEGNLSVFQSVVRRYHSSKSKEA